MQIETIAIDRINPLHAVRDRAKSAALTVSMREGGWVGRPALGELCADGYTVRLWTASHRFAAAKAAGLDEIEVALIDTDGLGDDYERSNADGLGECYRDALPEDDGEIARILADIDTEAAALFSLDADA